MFKKRENVTEIEEGPYLSPKFNEDGLIPVVTMCAKTKDILRTCPASDLLLHGDNYIIFNIT